jgi:hypothetical protein
MNIIRRLLDEYVEVVAAGDLDSSHISTPFTSSILYAQLEYRMYRVI